MVNLEKLTSEFATFSLNFLMLLFLKLTQKQNEPRNHNYVEFRKDH